MPRGQGAPRSCTRSCRSTRSRSSRTSATPASRARSQTTELDEGMFLLGLQAAAWRVPFLPTRVRPRLRRDAAQPRRSRTVKSPYADGEELVAMPALDLDVALIHMHRGDQGGTGQYLGVDPYFDDLMCMAATQALHVGRADRRHRRLPRATDRRSRSASTGS